MALFLLRRAGGLAIVMLLVALVVFVIVRVVPGDPAAVMLGSAATPDDVAALRTRLGFDQPLIVQFLIYCKQIASFDLGQSIFLNRPVSQAIAERAELTTLLTLMSAGLAVAIGVPVGIISAVRRGRASDHAATAGSMLFASLPSFWVGLTLIEVLAVRHPWFPVAGWGDPGDGLGAHLYHLVLPAVALGLPNSALIIRFTRSSMLDVLGEDYIRTARAKGVGSWSVVTRHALRNALIPVLDRDRSDDRDADRRRHRHRNGLRPARRRQSRRLGGAAPRLSGDSGHAAGDLRHLRSDQPRRRSPLRARRSAGAHVTEEIASTTPAIPAEPPEVPTSRSPGRQLAGRLVRRPTSLAALAVLILVVLAAALASNLAPYAPTRMDIAHRLAAPDGRHLLGSDDFGRDVLSRLLFGARLSLTVGTLVVVLATVLGLVIGLLAGYVRRLDAALMRFTDALMAFPDILLAIALMAGLGPSLFDVVLALGIVYTPRVARIVRGATLVLREMPFVEAAKSMGASDLRIMAAHLVPNLTSALIVQGTFIFGYAILTEAALSFLGTGVPPTTPTWGNMMAGAQQYMGRADWLILAPGAAIVLTVLSLQILGDGLRDALDPKLQRLM